MPLSNILTQKGLSMTSQTALTAITTTGIKIEAESAFTAFRVVIYHHSSATTIYSLIGAVTETADHVDFDERSLPIQDGITRDTLNDVGGKGWFSATNLTATGSGTVDAPEILISDLISLSSIARTDGGARPLVMVRVCATNADVQNSSRCNSNTMEDPTSANKGRILQTLSKAGDKVADFTDTMQLNVNAIPIGIQFTSTNAGLTIVGNGDSITEGRNQVADHVTNWGYRGAALASTTTKPVTWVNEGQSAEPSSVYQANGLVNATQLSASAQIYSAASPNDYNNPDVAALEVVIDTMDDRLDEIIENSAANNRIPTTFTWIPNSNELDATTDPLRKEYNETLKARAAARGIYVVDFDNLLSDGGNPASIKSQFGEGDGTHPSEAGHEAMGTLFSQKITEILEDLTMVTPVLSYFPLASGNKTTGLVDEKQGFSLGPLDGVYPVDPFGDNPGEFTHSDLSATGDRYTVKVNTALGNASAQAFYDSYFNLGTLKAQATGSTVGVLVGFIEVDGTIPSGAEVLWTWGFQALSNDALTIDISGGSFRALHYSNNVADAISTIAGNWGTVQRIAWVVEMNHDGAGADRIRIYTMDEGVGSPQTTAMTGSYFSLTPTDNDAGMAFFGIGRTTTTPPPAITRFGARDARDARSKDWGFIQAVGDDVSSTLYEFWIADFFANGGYPLSGGAVGSTGIIGSFIK